MRDITERKIAREELLRREAHYRSLIDNGWEIITILDSDGCIRFGSPSLERTLGYGPDELTGQNLFEFIHPDDVPGILRIFAEQLRIPGIGPVMEISFRHKDGSWRVLESRANNLLHDPVIGGIVVNSHDVTDRNRAEEELRYLSTHDALTGLFNRAFFEAEVSRLQRSRQFPVSVVMVDVDGLKDTNDNQGHAAGDELLRAAAHLLQSAFRAEDILARIGGDEFAILLPMTDSAAAHGMLERVRKSIAGHARERRALYLSLSLGSATANTPAMLADALKQADRRMYRDKSERTRPRDTGPLRLN
jgi:diguanylate cyclase (GGDEF)-like protein/PAS domain S-box-containing protein